jgi:hypothetical protein
VTDEHSWPVEKEERYSKGRSGNDPGYSKRVNRIRAVLADPQASPSRADLFCSQINH